MNIDEWFQWPTKSTDPAANAAIAVLLALVIIAAVAMGALVLLPVVLVIGIAKGVHWYVNRPTPTDQLYAQSEQRTIAANFPTTEQFVESYIARLIESWQGSYPAYKVFVSVVHIADALYKGEDLNNPLPPIPPSNTIEEGRYRDKLIARMRKSADAPKTLDAFTSTIGRSLVAFVAELPPIARTTPEIFRQTDEWKPFATVPLIDILPNIGKSVFNLAVPYFSEEVEQLGLFTDLKRQLDRNFHEASGLAYPAPSDKLVMPDKHKGTPQEIVHAYLHDTPLEPLFYADIPFSFTDAQRYEHMHIVGGSGHGKTQLLQHFILTDLQRDKPPALIVIDSQGDMLKKIEKLQLFTGALADKLIVIDPEDIEHPPALNMFDTTNARLAGYSLTHKEQIEAGVIELYNYIFASIAAEMTSRQSTAFAFVTRLILSIPGSTIHNLRELMEDPAQSLAQSKYAERIAKLDPTSQAYFENQFFTKRYSDLRQQIARRLYGVLSVPSFDRMFSSKENKLDMFEAMQAGKVVLVNTSRALLKSDASALFGRYMIALAVKAAYERVAVQERRPAFLFVDEAAEYFDDNIEALLSQARKFNLGLVIAHQHLDQLSTALRSAVAANTTIKLAGGVSDRDARAIAPDMRTSADFITSMAKHQRSTEFACHVRNYTGNAVRLEVPFGTLEAAPKMSSDAHDKLIAQNRARYTAQTPPPEPPPKQETEQQKNKPQEPTGTNPDTISTDAAKKW